MKTVFAITALIQNDQHKTLLLKRNEIEYNGYWQFPEGKIDGKEEPLEALKRELKEEIGATELTISVLGEFTCDFVLHGIPVKLVRHIYKASLPKKIVLSEEHSEYGCFNIKETSKVDLIPGVKEILKKYIV